MQQLKRVGRCLFSIIVVTCTLDAAAADLVFPPRLPNARHIATDRTSRFLQPSTELHAEVQIAKAPPTVDFLYYPEQMYPGKPWSVWGDSLAAGGRYYSAIGDHRAPQGNAFVFSYDPKTKSLRTIVDIKSCYDCPPDIMYLARSTAGSIWGATVGCILPRIAVRLE